jgi:hypothetical protein
MLEVQELGIAWRVVLRQRLEGNNTLIPQCKSCGIENDRHFGSEERIWSFNESGECMLSFANFVSFFLMDYFQHTRAALRCSCEGQKKLKLHCGLGHNP